jgi:hypothetical protein
VCLAGLHAHVLHPQDDCAVQLGFDEVTGCAKQRLRWRCVGGDRRLGVHQTDLLEQRRSERLLGDEPVRDEHLTESAAGALVLLKGELELTPAQQTALDEQLAERKPGSGFGGHHLTNRRFPCPFSPSKG